MNTPSSHPIPIRSAQTLPAMHLLQADSPDIRIGSMGSGSSSMSETGPTAEKSPSPRASEPGSHQLSDALERWVSRAAAQDAYAYRFAANRIQHCITNGGTVLNLGNSHLESLPDVLWTQTQLTQLHLGMNQLGHLPAEIGQLTNLTHLIVSDNHLRGLPNTLGSLTKLVVLDLSRNWLGAPPMGLKNLQNLKQLYLNGNAMKAPHPSLAELPESCIVSMWDDGSAGSGKAPTQFTFPDAPKGPLVML